MPDGNSYNHKFGEDYGIFDRERSYRLKAEDQLALIWFAYTEMGKTITIAAPGSTSTIFAQKTLLRLVRLIRKQAFITHLIGI